MHLVLATYYFLQGKEEENLGSRTRPQAAAAAGARGAGSGGGRRPKKGSWWVNTHRLVGHFAQKAGLVGFDPLWGSLGPHPGES